jgi:hypothetical protein
VSTLRGESQRAPDHLQRPGRSHRFIARWPLHADQLACQGDRALRPAGTSSRAEGDKRIDEHRAARVLRGCFGRSDDARNAPVLSQPIWSRWSDRESSPRTAVTPPCDRGTGRRHRGRTAGEPPKRLTRPEGTLVFGGRPCGSPPLAFASPRMDRWMSASTAQRCQAAIFFRGRRLSWGRAVPVCTPAGMGPRRVAPAGP